jgi:hypothetical protein
MLNYKGHSFEDVCHCGSCDDAMDAAIHLVRQNIRLSSDTEEGNGCAVWHYAVAQAYAVLASQIFMAVGIRQRTDNAKEIETDKLHELYGEERADIDMVYDRLMAFAVDNPEFNKKIADVVCELGKSELSRPIVESGPAKEQVAIFGRIDRMHEGSGLSDMLVAMFGKGQVFTLDEEGGIEPVDTPLSDAVKRNIH